MSSNFIPPKVLQTQIEFSNKYIEVKTESLLFERENNGSMEELKKDYYSAKCEDFVVGIVMKDNSILTLSQYRVPIKQFNTEFVAGSIEPNETRDACIIKELAEEAGIKTSNPRFLGEVHPLSGFTSCTAYVYLITEFEEVPTNLEVYEEFTCLSHQWISIDEFKTLLQSNKITDGVTLMAWALFREIISVRA